MKARRDEVKVTSTAPGMSARIQGGPDLSQGLDLDLPSPLPRDVEQRADLIERLTASLGHIEGARRRQLGGAPIGEIDLE